MDISKETQAVLRQFEKIEAVSKEPWNMNAQIVKSTFTAKSALKSAQKLRNLVTGLDGLILEWERSEK